MTLTKYVATKDLFQALIQAKRGVRPVRVGPTPMPAVGAPVYAGLLLESGAVQPSAQLEL